MRRLQKKREPNQSTKKLLPTPKKLIELASPQTAPKSSFARLSHPRIHAATCSRQQPQKAFKIHPLNSKAKANFPLRAFSLERSCCEASGQHEDDEPVNRREERPQPIMRKFLPTLQKSTNAQADKPRQKPSHNNQGNSFKTNPPLRALCSFVVPSRCSRSMKHPFSRNGKTTPNQKFPKPTNSAETRFGSPISSTKATLPIGRPNRLQRSFFFSQRQGGAWLTARWNFARFLRTSLFCTLLQLAPKSALAHPYHFGSPIPASESHLAARMANRFQSFLFPQ